MKSIIKTLIFAVVFVIASPKIFAQVSIGFSIRINPPALPVYTQPPCPVDGYLWTPGYWAYDNNSADYYWVPGVWVAPPQPGYLWTPGYWGYNGDVYAFHRGYWGLHIGFYGGVNYGYGYGGSGFYGGQWSGNSFRYNTAVVNVNNTVVHNTYVDKTVIVNNNTTVNNNTSFNGPGGIAAKPRPEEVSAMHESHINATPEQQSHQRIAKSDRSQYASVNKGRPATVAMNKVNGERFNNSGRPAKAGPTDNENANRPDNPQRVQDDQHKPQGNADDNATKDNKPDNINTDMADKKAQKQNTDVAEKPISKSPQNRAMQQHKPRAFRAAPVKHNAPKPQKHEEKP